MPTNTAPTTKLTLKSVVEQSFGVIPIYRKTTDDTYQFLLIQHRAGHWAFPKGHADKGESDLQAARRELHEETGIADVLLLTSPVFEERYRVTRKGKQRAKVVRYWLGFVRSKRVTIQPKEIRAHRWTNAREACALITYAQNRALFKKVLAHLGV